MKITALRTVYWDDGFGVKKGKVKKIYASHAEVSGENGLIYMIEVAKLSTAPIQKIAMSGKRTIISEGQNAEQE
jgi:hypothetical protein